MGKWLLVVLVVFGGVGWYVYSPTNVVSHEEKKADIYNITSPSESPRQFIPLPIEGPSPAQSDDEKRDWYGQMARLAAALAEPVLASIIKNPGSEFDLMQAAMAISDVQGVGDEALSALEGALQKTLSEESRHVVMLALGAVARQAPNGQRVVPFLLETAGLADSAAKRVEVTAAMGNHGHGEYFETIRKFAQDSSEQVRAASVYAARNIQTEDARSLIVKLGINDPSALVRAEALQSLASRRDWGGLVEMAQDEGQAVEVARILVESERSESTVAEAQRLKLSSKSERVKALLAQGGL